MLVSGVQQSDSFIHMHTSILFQILFPFRLWPSIEQSSLECVCLLGMLSALKGNPGERKETGPTWPALCLLDLCHLCLWVTSNPQSGQWLSCQQSLTSLIASIADGGSFSAPEKLLLKKNHLKFNARLSSARPSLRSGPSELVWRSCSASMSVGLQDITL